MHRRLQFAPAQRRAVRHYGGRRERERQLQHRERRHRVLLALDQLLSEYRARTGPNNQTYLAFRADVAALLAQTGNPAAAISRYEALIRDAPDSPARSHWEESLQAVR